MTSLWRNIPSGSVKLQNFYSKQADGVIVRNEFWSVVSIPVNLTLNKSTVVLNNIQLSLTVISDIPFSGTVGKGVISVAPKQLSVNGGVLITSPKSTINLNNYQLDVAAGFGVVPNKTTLSISSKTDDVLAGTTADLQKFLYTSTYKPLRNSLGFVSGLNNNTIVTNNRQLFINIPYTTLVNKWSELLTTQQLFIDIPHISVINKWNGGLSTKPLGLTVSSEIPYSGLINKSLLVVGNKPLSVVVPFIAETTTSNILINSKQLENVQGSIFGVNRQSLFLSDNKFVVSSGVSCLLHAIITPVITKQLSTQYGWSGSLLPNTFSINESGLSLVSKFDSILNPSALVLNGKQLQVSTHVVAIFVPTEQLFSFSKRNQSFVFKPHNNIYTLTDN